MSQDASEKIAMPVRRFIHPDAGSVVTVIGTIHCAQPSYYAQLNAMLTDFDAQGTTIHYEQVGEPTEEELANACEEIKHGAEQIRARLAKQNAWSTSAGLVLQKEHLTLRDTWENHDVTLIGAAQFYGVEILRQQEAADQKADFMLDHLSAPIRRGFLLESNAAAMKVVTGEVSFETVFPGVERQLAMLRETVAFSAFDVHRATDPAADIALIWGAAHLPHLSRGLAQRGYKEDGETWITAIDPATLPPLD